MYISRGGREREADQCYNAIEKVLYIVHSTKHSAYASRAATCLEVGSFIYTRRAALAKCVKKWRMRVNCALTEVYCVRVNGNDMGGESRLGCRKNKTYGKVSEVVGKL